MYHVFIDYEMTCWKKSDQPAEIYSQEIIEIGAVKLDEDFHLIDTFSTYVKPEHSQQLSKSCKALTGIGMGDVLSAPSLAEAVIIFEDWLGCENFKLYSWGDDDRTQLERELTGKGLCSSMPKHYRRWLDFQRIFMRVYGFTRRMKLKSAVEIFGLEFEGRQHRAVDDAINGAKLLMLMKDKEKHKKQKEIISEVNKNRPFTSTIGELLSDKLAALGLVS